MINILHVFVTLPIGGAEELLLTVLKNTDRTRYQPTICCIGEKGAIGEEIEKAGFHLISLRRMSKCFDCRIVIDLIKIIRGRNIDIVQCHLFHANMYGRIAAIISGVPVIATEHNVYSTYKLRRRIINWILAKKTKHIVAVSQKVRDHIVARDWIKYANISVIHNGIDVSRFPSPLPKEEARKKIGVPANIFLIGTVGRISEQKGHVYLLKALEKIKNTAPDARMLIIGSGPLEDDLKRIAREKGLAQAVYFTGYRRDIPDVLKAMDIFTFPSLWEGLPVALLEAMASYLPVIATPVGGIPEIVQDHVNGLIVQPRDDHGLAKAIMHLYREEGIRKSLGCHARETVMAKFNAVTMVQKLEFVYQSVLKTASRTLPKI